jgi:hypothetical protein
MKRSTVVRVVVVAAAALTAVPAVAVATAAPVLDQKCSLGQYTANVRVQTHAGHAVSGSWTLHPILACQDAESGLTVHAELDHDGRSMLVSDGSCTSTIPSCTSAVGGVKRAQLGLSIRGTYVLKVAVTITGADAALIQGCDYSATTLTATCTATSTQTVIR